MTTLQISLEDELKKQAEMLFASLGLDTGTAVRMFLVAALENDGLPFSVRHKNGSFAESIEDARLRRDLFGPYDSAEDAVRAMLSD